MGYVGYRPFNTFVIMIPFNFFQIVVNEPPVPVVNEICLPPKICCDDGESAGHCFNDGHVKCLATGRGDKHVSFITIVEFVEWKVVNANQNLGSVLWQI